MNILRLADFPSKEVLQNKQHEIHIYGLGITHIYPLSAELLKMGHSVRILSGGAWTSPSREEVDGIHVFRTHIPRKPYYLPFGMGVLANFGMIEKEYGRIDVVHAHNPWCAFGYSYLKSLFPKVPLVVTIHGMFKYGGAELIFLKNLIKHTDHFIAINLPSFQLMKKLGVDEKNISLIPTGVDTDIFRKCCNSENIILYAGRLVNWKNVETLIKAAYELKDTHPELKYYIVGDGEHRDFLVNMVSEYGLSSRFIFLGGVRFDEMPQIYSKALVTVAPHIYDSFGKTVLESLACETPVVGTASDIPPDISQCGTFIENPKDEVAFAEAIRELVENEDYRRRIGKKGRDVVQNNYTWRKCAERNVGVYEKLVKNRKYDRT